MKIPASIRILFIFTVSVFIIGCSSRLQVHDRNSISNKLTVYFLDVGQGDSTLLILPDSTIILVDTGSPAAGPGLVDNLSALGIEKIDHLILTHPHDDHIGGIFNVLYEIEVMNVYDNGFDNAQSTLFWDYEQVVRNDHTGYRILRKDDSLHFGDVILTVLNPMIPPAGNINEDSIVLKVTYGTVGILLTGDLRRTGEKRILDADLKLKSSILKIGHHGDRNASSAIFLNDVDPDIAVISAGKDNKYGKPHEEALSRITASGAKVMRTDLMGHIIVQTDGHTYTVQSRKHLTGILTHATQ